MSEAAFQGEEKKTEDVITEASDDTMNDFRASVGSVDGKAHRCSRKCLVVTSITQLLLILGLVAALMCLLFIPTDSNGEQVVQQLRYSTRPHHIGGSIRKFVDREWRHHGSILGEGPQWSVVSSSASKALEQTKNYGGTLKSMNMALTAYVLWYLHYDLNGSTGVWSNADADTCLWDGVRCDLEGKVVELDLEGRGFSGELPSTLWLLAGSLRKINVKDNKDLGRPSLPAFLTQMPHLNHINICGTEYGILESDAICAKEIAGSAQAMVIYSDFDCDCCVSCGVSVGSNGVATESGYDGDEDGRM